MRWLLVALAGCRPPPGQADEPFVYPDPPPPRITSFSFSCDPTNVVWEVAIGTDAWSGGVESHWTEDGEYVERHDVPVVAAAEDGSWDELGLSVAMVADWREAGPSTTTFSCADEVNAVFVLKDRAGARADCRVVGPMPDVFAELELPSCKVEAERG